MVGTGCAADDAGTTWPGGAGHDGVMAAGRIAGCGAAG
jgi:hypothetical protein